MTPVFRNKKWPRLIENPCAGNQSEFARLVTALRRPTHLYSVLRQLRRPRKGLAGVHVRIMSLIESLLELLHLVAGEYGPATTVDVIVKVSVVLFGSIYEQGSAIV